MESGELEGKRRARRRNCTKMVFASTENADFTPVENDVRYGVQSADVELLTNPIYKF